MAKKLIKTVIPPIIIVVLVVCGYFYFQHQAKFPSTNDAYVQANVIYIAPQVSGNILNVYIVDQQHVKKGDPLFDIDPTPFKIAVNSAEAQLQDTMQQIEGARSDLLSAEALVAERQAQLTMTQKNFVRIMSLVEKHLYAASAGDQAISDFQVAQATLKSAQSQLDEAKQKLGDPGKNNVKIQEALANLAQAKLNLQYTHVTAPSDGQLVNVNLSRGTAVTAYQELFALVDARLWWVNANFKETQLMRILPGMPATVILDMYPRKIYKGLVRSISPGSGESFSLLPPENATGNWVKVTQRFTVRIELKDDDAAHPLRMGASCTATVDTTRPPKL